MHPLCDICHVLEATTSVVDNNQCTSRALCDECCWEQRTGHPKVIIENLWKLLLSTNDCHPGCSCEDDYFKQTPERVAAWVETAGRDAALQALSQLDRLLSLPQLDRQAIENETNTVFQTEVEVRTWLATWRPLLAEAISTRTPAA